MVKDQASLRRGREFAEKDAAHGRHGRTIRFRPLGLAFLGRSCFSLRVGTCPCPSTGDVVPTPQAGRKLPGLPRPGGNDLGRAARASRLIPPSMRPACTVFWAAPTATRPSRTIRIPPKWPRFDARLATPMRLPRFPTAFTARSAKEPANPATAITTKWRLRRSWRRQSARSAMPMK